MAKRMRTGLPSLLVLGLAGCATVAAPPRPANEGSASYHLVDNGRMAHYTLALGDVAMGSGTIHRVLPVYPSSQLAACPPVVDVGILAIVDTTGMASEVRRYP
ncbi:hypothetical protein WHL36_14510, partial [Staphylococcus aureus]|uniref:hypothetical protein n=1 Tax=Staphylococcus aureus TaxID=1280 RepID=UPI0039BDEB64